MIPFKWDKAKNAINIQKHGVSFEEAQSVFYDESHSDLEDRFIMLGFSSHLRLLVVCHCIRKKKSVIRIISARKATTNESKYYGG
ncbi:BrnT family toxin [Sediminispirochaeta smaragdinae]|uniref:BrnT family toxin n=1 Tax=Sediminispirochaeta smaragdinae (strain DSM 11293 / JCM 15392 / SEBR 4228) TaxID=573413 RepID=E1R6Y5_SEDSS|nr:BrnT family toxin [Sediminispirochaeta smaragdinae]ADK81312.1 protein of unknown function DUF497 [Sediminispirochaeta smaragdinae DSM 11293]